MLVAGDSLELFDIDLGEQKWAVKPDCHVQASGLGITIEATALPPLSAMVGPYPLHQFQEVFWFFMILYDF